MMADATIPNDGGEAMDRMSGARRWYQFRLSSLIWLTLVVVAFIGGSLWGEIRLWQPEDQSIGQVYSHPNANSGQPAFTIGLNDTLAVEFPAGVLDGFPEGHKFPVTIVDFGANGSADVKGADSAPDASGGIYYEVSGVVQVGLIRPDKTVLSSDVARLQISKAVGRRPPTTHAR
jgi:hypothetical protein